GFWLAAGGLVFPQMWIYTFPSTSPFSPSCIHVIKYIGLSITPLQMLVPTGCLAGCIITLKKTCVEATKKNSHVLARGTQH
uniref:Uncharacterized protein n=1 Tax=Catharus ustulatus TaxID=91951 RepID=A0A8C3U4Y8_CATUS